MPEVDRKLRKGINCRQTCWDLVRGKELWAWFLTG